jgi:hypothetical protein
VLRTLDQPWPIAVGLVATIVAGFAVKRIIALIAQPEKPQAMTDVDWQLLVGVKGVGDKIGILERLLSFASLASGQYVILGGWLAFKLAAKWEVWKHIIQVPQSVDGISPLVWFQARNAFGSWVLSRFLIGTLANVLVGFIGAAAGALAK